MGNDPRGLGAFCAQTSLLISLLLLSAQLVSTKSGWNRLRSRSLPTKRHQQQWQEYGIDGSAKQQKSPRMHTLFSVECNHYFDWQTVGLMNSYRKSGHPGPITRLLSCTDDQLKTYPGMHLAPTHVVPSMSHHPKTGDWYPAINKPAGVVHWLENSPDAKNAEWVVILDADMIIRKPIIPWELGVEKGKPVAALYGYLIGCDNILAKLHTKHPELCDKVGGLLAMHMDDLRALAPLWLSKTEEVRADKEHWATNYTGDIYASGWISEMYGYSFGAAEVGLRHKISNDLMIYPGYIPWEGVEPILMHYGLKFSVGTWSFSKADHHDDDIVYQCNKLFPAPPYPKEVLVMEPDLNKRRGLFLSIECMNSLNEALVDIHRVHGCPESSDTKYTRFLKVWRETLRELSYSDVKRLHENESDAKIESMPYHRNKTTFPKYRNPSGPTKELIKISRIHTLFSTECSSYFDWQTVGLMHSFELSGQPGSITRLLSCTEDQLKTYNGMDLAPTHVVPSYSHHPLTNDWYPAINKPVSLLHWVNHVSTDAEFVVILDADMILRKPITPWEFGARKGHPVSVPYLYLIGCDNELAKLHTHHPEACEKVGGVIIMHIDDLREFAPLWLHKTEEVRADRAHWATNYSGDIYGHGWISEMYGYSFGAAELGLKHIIRNDIMHYPGNVPVKEVEPHVLHYGLEFSVGNWSFDKARWRDKDMTNMCWNFFPDPPDPESLEVANVDELRRDIISIGCIRTLNDALYLHHKRRGCHEAADEGAETVLENAEDEIMDIPERKEKHTMREDGEEQVARKPPDTLHDHETEEVVDAQELEEVDDEDGFEVEDNDIDKHWDMRKDPMTSHKESDDAQKTADWENKETSSKGSTHTRKLSNSGGVITTEMMNPEYSMLAVWSVSFLLFVLIACYVSSSRLWHKNRQTKGKLKRVPNVTSNGEPYRTASNAD